MLKAGTRSASAARCRGTVLTCASSTASSLRTAARSTSTARPAHRAARRRRDEQRRGHLRHVAARADAEPQHERSAADDPVPDAGRRESRRRLRSVQGRPDVPLRSRRHPPRLGRAGHAARNRARQGSCTSCCSTSGWTCDASSHLDMKEHPQGRPRSSLGHSIGHFDGDTLVIETANYPAGVLNQYVEQPGQPTRGMLHSAALTSVERLHLDAAAAAPRSRDRPRGPGVLHSAVSNRHLRIRTHCAHAGAVSMLARERKRQRRPLTQRLTPAAMQLARPSCKVITSHVAFWADA